jgi:hypothetical protein
MAAGLPNATGFTHASLTIEGQPPPIECWFNPKEYAISKSNTWTVDPVVGTGLPTAQFGGGQARELSLDLFFDATDSDRDVRGVTDRLFKMMEVDARLDGGQQKNSGRPPTVTFAWGEVVTFKAVAKQLSVQYTLFDPSGAPLRAQAKLALVQVEKAVDKSSGRTAARGQNPSTRGLAGIRSYLVRDGDSLPSIAYAEYGDATRWRDIAEANGIDDPLRVPRGRALSVPRITDEAGRG